MPKLLIVTTLIIILLLIYRSLVLRERILSYLKEHYGSVYEEIRLSYTIKGILAGNPEVFLNQLRQSKKLMSREICYDAAISSLQRKYKVTILITLITTACYIVFLIFGLRLILSSWTRYI